MKKFQGWEIYVGTLFICLGAVLCMTGVGGAVMGLDHWYWMPVSLVGIVFSFIAMVILSWSH